jgi:hypothetical protein
MKGGAMNGRGVVGARIGFGVVLAIGLCTACGITHGGPAPARVTAEMLPWADLSSYRTYRWWKPAPKGGSERAALIDWYVRNGVDRELASRGWVPDVEGMPDFVVRYEIAVLEGSTSSVQEYAAYRAEGGSKDMGEAFMGYDLGTLTVSIVDVESRRVAWRGKASAIVEQDLRGQRIDPAIHEMFARLPPGAHAR